jgi:hypothetical protein
MEPGTDVKRKYNGDFLAGIGQHVKDLVAAFDAQVKAHAKFRDILKVAGVS